MKAIHKNVYEKTKYAEQVQTRVIWEHTAQQKLCKTLISGIFPSGQKIIWVDAPKGETQKVKRTDVHGRGRLLNYCRGSSASAEQC